jgi:uncharacterized protein with NRDE domain
MCLVALALGAHPRFPLVVAANRDEFFARPTAPLDWWQPEGAREPVLSGRDLSAGGTWMGLTRSGRLAFLTNVRRAEPPDPAAASRGRIVTDWLGGADADAEHFWRRIAGARHNGFNLVFGDVNAQAHPNGGAQPAPRGGLRWATNAGLEPRALGAGLHAVSNAALDTPWPKLLLLKTGLAAALARASSGEALVADLFSALADRSPAPDDLLPDTGVPHAVERGLSSAFVAMPERGYGTRSSTLIVAERADGRIRTQVLEQAFDASGAATCAPRSVVLDDWPPG